MSLLDRVKKNSTIELSSSLDESEVFTDGQEITTEIPIINAALSGDLSGGMRSGVTMIAGPSKHFKSMLGLILVRSFLRKYKDGVVLFYDSEFGTPKNYFKTFGIDMERVVHSPIVDIEQLKHDVMVQLKDMKREDHVLIFIDSIGQLASTKEVDDALEGKSVADMTRAKSMKSLFRMITPHLRLKDIPLVVINHTYKEIGMFPKDIVGGGTGSYFASDTIWIVGRQQEKIDGEVAGFNFTLNSEKSRFVKEKSKFNVTVTYEKGVEIYSGLLENALEMGIVSKPSPGWYQKKGSPNKVREAETKTAEFWKDILASEEFNEFIRKKYTVAYGQTLPAEK